MEEALVGRGAVGRLSLTNGSWHFFDVRTQPEDSDTRSGARCTVSERVAPDSDTGKASVRGAAPSGNEMLWLGTPVLLPPDYPPRG